MERSAAIENEAQKLCEERFGLIKEEIQKTLIKEQETILTDLKNTFDQLFVQAEQQQTENRKDKARYIVVSHLYSGFVSGSYEYRIDILDESMYLDTQECCVYWQPRFLFPYTEADHQWFKTMLRKKYIRLRNYEIRKVEWNYQFYYHSIIYHLLKNMVNEIERMESFIHMQKTDETLFLFGEYMGEAFRI